MPVQKRRKFSADKDIRQRDALQTRHCCVPQADVQNISGFLASVSHVRTGIGGVEREVFEGGEVVEEPGAEVVEGD